MRKFKITFGLIIIAAAALFFFQNKIYFLAKQELTFTIPLLEPYHLPETNNAILFLAAFCIGLLIAYFFSLLERFKAKRTEKNLNATIAAQMESIAALKRENESSPNTASPPEKQGTQDPQQGSQTDQKPVTETSTAEPPQNDQERDEKSS